MGFGDEFCRGYILIFLIVGVFIVIGELNVIVLVILNFFFMFYVFINYVVFVVLFGKLLGWRFFFKYYNMWVFLIGFMVCVVIMFFINWWVVLLIIVIIIVLYKYVDYKKFEVSFDFCVC